MPSTSKQTSPDDTSGLSGVTSRTWSAMPSFSRFASPWIRAATLSRPRPTTNAAAEDVAARLRQLDQLKESGLLDEAAYAEQRKRILAEL